MLRSDAIVLHYGRVLEHTEMSWRVGTSGEGLRPTTPRGFRDILFQEAAERKAVVGSMLDVATAWGYREVETPILERAETLAAGTGASVVERESFRLFDQDGGLLALRPEMTVPIARLVASRLEGERGPQRLSYAADVFREHASYRGQYRQFTQFGIELVGGSGPESDAEVVAVMVEALEATGLEEYRVGVGTVAVLRALLEASGTRDVWRDAVMDALHDRNLVELDTLTGGVDLKGSLRRALREVPRLRGGREVIATCRELVEPCGCADAVDGLSSAWDLLEAAGVAERVTVDLGLLRSFDYYTGMVLEAYAPRFGLPLGGGGRYDGLLAEFGAPRPAAGFALGLERVHIALAEQGRIVETPSLDVVLGGATARDVFAAARAVRAENARVVIMVDPDRQAVESRARDLGASRVLWAEGDAVTSLTDGGEA